MNTNLQENQLAKVITNDDLKILEQAGIIPKNTPVEQVAVFGKICQEKGLSPFTKQIYLLPFKSKSGEQWITQYATITGIDGYRTIAERTGRYAGNDDYIFDEGKTEFQCRHEGRKTPTTATATVYKLISGQRVPHSATASWESYFPGDSKGFNWKRMPFFMLGKCAEALAMRKAFPEALGNIYVEEERGSFEAIPQKPEQKPISQEDINLSAEILLKFKQFVTETKTSVEVKQTAADWLKDAASEGMMVEHQKELQKFINEQYIAKKAKA